MNLHKLDSENEEQFIWRLASAKDTGELNMSWEELTEILNKELGYEDKPFSEAAFRKPYQQAKRFVEAGVFNKFNEDEYLDELKSKKQELAKQQVKIRDERNELARLIREEARKENYIDMVKRTISENIEPVDIVVVPKISFGNNDLLCSLSDLHTGIKIDNWKNKFDENILKKRIEMYVENILEIKETHQSQDCYIVIGEILSGLIHDNLRLQNNLNLIEQFKCASELISSMLTVLAKSFNHIYVYTTQGNHSRVVAKKENSIDGENFDILLPFYLKARLQNIENISICDNEIEPEIAMFNIRGNSVFSSHGHKDNVATVVQNFTMMFGTKPDIVLLGHRHTNGLTTVYDTKVLETGCLSGTDSYAVSIRKVNKPEQVVSVISDKGLLCFYDLQFD